MRTTKIEWCDATINPVVGCKRGCVYCYAEKMNKRFGWVKNWNEPQFFPDRLKALYSKRPKSIFMNSMSDHNYWTGEQRLQVHRAMQQNPQHSYIFLTKTAACVGGIGATYDNSIKVYYGYTLTRQDSIPHCDFLSIEPILEPIKIQDFKNVKQIIIGAETGNRKGKVIPKKEWIDSLVKQADEHVIRVFMKDSLKPIMGDDFRTDKLIWSVTK